jgi:hypothetical protein
MVVPVDRPIGEQREQSGGKLYGNRRGEHHGAIERHSPGYGNDEFWDQHVELELRLDAAVR